MKKLTTMGLVFVSLSGAACAQDSTKQALREFGWEGVWSIDCSIPNISKDDDKLALPRLFNVIPLIGAPTKTIVMSYETGQRAGQTTRTVFAVKSAKMVTDTKLLLVVSDEAGKNTSETVLIKVGTTVVTLRGTVTNNASGVSYTSATNGVAFSLKGDSLGAGTATFERCRE